MTIRNHSLINRLGQLWEWSTSVTITRLGDFKRSGRNILDEIEIFKGDENLLTMRQTYTHKFQCVYILNRYPFDTQVGIKVSTNLTGRSILGLFVFFFKICSIIDAGVLD